MSAQDLDYNLGKGLIVAPTLGATVANLPQLLNFYDLSLDQNKKNRKSKNSNKRVKYTFKKLKSCT